MMFFDV